MDTPHSPQPAHGRSRLGRFGGLAALGLGFTIAAGVFGPFSSNAQFAPHHQLEPVRQDGRVLVGRTLGRSQQLIVYTSPDGVLYTVADTRGRILARDLSESDVYRTFPNLAPDSLHSGRDQVRGPLMMVDPDR